MNDKFIDLCVDDNSQDYGAKQPQLMAQFKQHLGNLNFQFETKLLDLPEAMTNDTEIDTECKNSADILCNEDKQLGEDLDAIFSLLNSETKEQFKHEKFIVEHKWSD